MAPGVKVANACDRMNGGAMAHLPFRNFVHLTQSEAYELMRNMLSGSMSTEGIADVIGFLYAPLLHPAVKHAQEARLLLKGRTVFNLLGPLTNPVHARVQLIGAFSVRAAEMLAHASARLGIERAFVVHGSDGLDEITTTGLT